MYHGSKLTNSLGKQQLEILTCTWSGCTCTPWLQEICVPGGIKYILFFAVSSTLRCKVLTGPTRNSEFWLLLMFPSLQGALSVLWENTVSLVASHCKLNVLDNVYRCSTWLISSTTRNGHLVSSCSAIRYNMVDTLRSPPLWWNGVRTWRLSFERNFTLIWMPYLSKLFSPCQMKKGKWVNNLT